MANRAKSRRSTPVGGPRSAAERSCRLAIAGAVVLAALTTGIDSLAGATPPAARASVVRVAGTERPGTARNRAPAAGGALKDPTGLALDLSGDLFIADTGNCRIDEVRGATRPARARLTTVAGEGCGERGFVNGAPARATNLGFAQAVAVDQHGDVFIAATSDDRILEVPGRSVAVGGMEEGHVYTVAGNGRAGFNGDGERAVDGQLNAPQAIALDASGDLFIADTANCRIREVPDHHVVVGDRVLEAGRLYTV